jgi:phosphocarrier protein HPr
VTGFAHPACLFVSGASKFSSTISLKYKSDSVNKKNSSNLYRTIVLRIKPGTYVEITENGCDQHAALQTIENSLSENLYIEPEKARE